MLNRSSIVFLALSILFGVGAAFAARSYLADQGTAPQAQAPVVPVVTAAREVPTGDAIAATDLALVDWPEAHLPAGVTGDANALVGRVLRRPLAAGEPVFESALLPSGTPPGLPALIAANHRAVSVKVDAVVGVAGFVQPGARVDVLATLRRQDAANFSNVILQDVRVLAVDQTLEEARDGEPKVVNVATLEVDTDEAERLVHAAHEGRLQLALRSPGDDRVEVTRAVSAADLLGAPRSAPRSSGPSVQVIRGTQVSRHTL